MKKPKIIDAKFTVVGENAISWPRVAMLAYAIAIGLGVHHLVNYLFHLVWPLRG